MESGNELSSKKVHIDKKLKLIWPLSIISFVLKICIIMQELMFTGSI
jgi:hypothetical protein